MLYLIRCFTIIHIIVGWRAATPPQRIVGGYDVSPPFKYNFIVPILRYKRYRCSGTLLTSNRVLTAAHCFSGALASLEHYQVHLHRHNLDLSVKKEKAKALNITKRWIHPNYDRNTEYNDIAIVELSYKKSNVLLVRLDKKFQRKEGFLVTILGWGALKEDQNSHPILQETVLPLNSNERCEVEYKLAEDYLIQSSHICAGGLGDLRDACSGDSGGPIFIVRRGIPVIIGVTSTGHACAHPTVPGLYMRIASYYPWITKVLSDKIKPTPYQKPFWQI